MLNIGKQSFLRLAGGVCMIIVILGASTLYFMEKEAKEREQAKLINTEASAETSESSTEPLPSVENPNTPAQNPAAAPKTSPRAGSGSRKGSSSGTGQQSSNAGQDNVTSSIVQPYGSQHSYSSPYQGNACGVDDNAPRINNEIRAAISQGKDSYLIPAGTCPLASPISFPDGTVNFAIIGAGSNQTVFTAPTVKLNTAFELGFPHFTFNNWGLTDLPFRSVTSAASGSQKITLAAGQAPLEKGWHFLWDEYGVVNRQGQYPIFNRAEIVEVKDYNATTRQATLDVALGRSFSVDPKIAPVGNRLAHNIMIKGISFDGTGPSGQFSNGVLYASMIKNLSVIDVAVKKFSGPAISIMLARNIDISGVSMTENIGSYGLGINKSRFADVHDSYAAPSLTTAFIGHTGAQDVIFRRLTTPRVDASHGYDEKRITVREIIGNASDPDYPDEGVADLTCGNLAWRDGVDGCFIQDISSAHEVFSGPNARNVVISNTKMHYLRVNDEDGIGPISTHVKNSEIRRKGIYNRVINLDWFHTDTNIGEVIIEQTKIIQDDPNGNFVIRGTNYIGELIIKNSEIINNSGRGYEMIYLTTNRDSYLTITDTKFTSATSDRAIYLHSFLNPCALIANNIYNVVGNNPTLFENTSICQ